MCPIPITSTSLCDRAGVRGGRTIVFNGIFFCTPKREPFFLPKRNFIAHSNITTTTSNNCSPSGSYISYYTEPFFAPVNPFPLDKKKPPHLPHTHTTTRMPCCHDNPWQQLCWHLKRHFCLCLFCTFCFIGTMSKVKNVGGVRWKMSFFVWKVGVVLGATWYVACCRQEEWGSW